MQHFQPILIVIGILAIAAVLIHGYILSRKEKAAVIGNPFDSENQVSVETVINEQEGIIGDVRIIHGGIEENEDCNFSVPLKTDDVDDIQFVKDLSFQVSPEDEEKKVSEDDFSMPLIHSSQEIIEPVALQNENDATLLDEIETVTASEQVELKNSTAEQQPTKTEVEDLFIFNVVAKEGAEVCGHELLQFFLTAGFRFGEMSIFHRHLYSDGTGPVLFSIANMMAPGIFEPENMEQFRSQGVSFFLTAPNNKINIKQAFDMMLVAVEQMAEEFDCVVLNAEREPLTEAQFRNYHERLLHYI